MTFEIYVVWDGIGPGEPVSYWASRGDAEHDAEERDAAFKAAADASLTYGLRYFPGRFGVQSATVQGARKP